jgi:ABC-type transport system involved in multi-copper enzyme maturation permease subunit
MPVFEQGYRAYVGEKARTNRAWAIAWENVRPRLRPWVWLLLFAVSFWPYLVHVVLVFMQTVATSLGASPVAPVLPKQTAFEQVDPFHGGVILGLIQNNPLALSWEMLFYASMFAPVIFGAVVASGLLASDRRTGALQIYFARPVSRLDYLLGKVAACTFFVALTTAVPCLLIWLESVAFAASSSYTWRTWVAPFSILGASSFHALWVVSLVLCFSSLVRRPAFAAIAVIFVHMALEGIGAILAEVMTHRGAADGAGRGWAVIQPSHAIGTVTAPLCGLAIPDWINPFYAFALAVGVPVVLLSFVWWRLKAVEVTT